MIDVCIDVYGKPYQTIATLESLFDNSGRHINKVFMTIEGTAPYMDNMSDLWGYIKKKEIDTHVPVEQIPHRTHVTIQEDTKYQYGIDKSIASHVFLCHNDIKFTGDIIGDMIEWIGDTAGIGLIGQCWNCPAKAALLCDGSKWESYNPTYDEAVELFKRIPPGRGSFRDIQNPPMPLYECRLNEFACLLNRDVLIKEQQHGNFFGLYDGCDIGSHWFRELVLKGNKFTNYDIGRTSKHCYWSTDCGYSTEKDEQLYFEAERRAHDEILGRAVLG